MGKYTARSAFDLDNTPLGTVVTNDKDEVTKFEPAPDEPQRFEQAVVEKWHISELEGRARLYTFEKDDEQGEADPADEQAEGDVGKQAEVQVQAGDIVKTNPDKRLVFGWAYITHDREGNLNIDKSGDFADDIEEIEKSAYDYVLRSRQSDADHTNVKGGEMVESIVFTAEKCEQMGIAKGSVPTGWWIGFRIEDDATWERVKKGELRAFSIHGKGTRSKVEE